MATALLPASCDKRKSEIGYNQYGSEDKYRSSQLQSVLNMRNEIEMYYDKPASRDIELRFYSLLTEWYNDIKFISSTTQILKHKAFREIVNMGSDVVPLIFDEIQNNPSFLFVALNEITGDNPIKKQNSGKIRRMIEDWIEWGKKKEYI